MQGCLGAQGRLCQGIISAWSGLTQRLYSPHTQLIHNFPLHILATVFRLALAAPQGFCTACKTILADPKRDVHERADLAQRDASSPAPGVGRILANG